MSEPIFLENENDWKSVTEIEWSESDWDYDSIRVYQNVKTGELVYATDWGCRCGQPFENSRLDQATPIRLIDDFIEIIESLTRDNPSLSPRVFREVIQSRDLINKLLSEPKSGESKDNE